MSRDNGAAVVGLGNLGRAIALRLLERGWDLRVADTKAARVGPLIDAGAVQTNPAGLADVGIVCFAVPDAQAIRTVLEEGLASRLGPFHTVVVHSTVLPAEAKALAATVEARGASFVEAPVSGGAERALHGDLAVMLGGQPAAISGISELIADLARQSFELGSVGAASATKLANQLVMFATLAGLTEGLRLAASHGVTDTAALEAFAAGTGDTWVGRNWGFFDAVASDYDAAGVLISDRPWSKDIWEILAAGREADVELPFAGLLSQTIARTVESHATTTRKGEDA
ncbi:NAD(P)-dependent oxidoreductase [Gryllotalpicola reticulitermitis]|uniref:NAD(P)-dependent oxidoreductase n=1 Tax=Gryllotalpicola reticulitermitis TaxID=1184153 RepID=A0ABV8QD85_9MICO